jgi:hypothetical protein
MPLAVTFPAVGAAISVSLMARAAGAAPRGAGEPAWIRGGPAGRAKLMSRCILTFPKNAMYLDDADGAEDLQH